MKALLLFFLFLSASLVGGSGLGVSPSQITFSNVLPGSTFSKQIKIDNTADADILVAFMPQELDSWLSFSSSEVMVPAKGSGRGDIIIAIPHDAQIGIRTSRVLLQPKPVSTSGFGVLPATSVTVSVQVTNKKIKEGVIDSMRIRNGAANKEIPLLIGFVNQGNIEATPLIRVIIMTLGGTLVKSIEQAVGPVAPYQFQELTVPLTVSAIGDYRADVSVQLDGRIVKEQTITFSAGQEQRITGNAVLEQAGTGSKGIALGILFVVLGLGAYYYFITKRNG